MDLVACPQCAQILKEPTEMARKLFTFTILQLVFMYVSASPSSQLAVQMVKMVMLLVNQKKWENLDVITLNPEKIEGVYHSSVFDM